MQARREYDQYLARSGAGVDAAGRLVFSGPDMMYAGPREFASASSTLSEMRRRAEEEESEAEKRQRQMLDMLARHAPPTGYKFDPRMLAVGNSAYEIHQGRS